MLSVDEALSLVLARATPKPPTLVARDDGLGLVLAEDVTSDVDSPPHDKSLVDGYAVIAVDLAGGEAELEILEEVTAGAVPTRPLAGGQTSRIMTGAPIPAGADAVVMIERASSVSTDGHVRLAIERALAVGQNIMRRGTSMVRGQKVLSGGCLLRPIEIGVLAEVGRAQVRVVPRPTVTVLATGNELVAPEQAPGPGQIRNSNGPLLAAAARLCGARVTELGIARDDRAELGRLIGEGLRHDVLLISGGVSAGVLDLVPDVLVGLGVERVFHKVNLKPGKPLWFGTLADSGIDAREKLVFGLPGNPVSSLVCFELFARPAIARMRGADESLVELTAELVVDHQHRGDRPTYHPARLHCDANGWLIEPLKWQGSGDLRTLADANALACFAAGDRHFERGESIRVLRLPR